MNIVPFIIPAAFVLLQPANVSLLATWGCECVHFNVCDLFILFSAKMKPSCVCVCVLLGNSAEALSNPTPALLPLEIN